MGDVSDLPCIVLRNALQMSRCARGIPPQDAHRDLGGERPVDLIASDRMDEVLAIIDRLQSAAYA